MPPVPATRPTSKRFAMTLMTASRSVPPLSSRTSGARTTCWEVPAERAGPHGALETASERRELLFDAPDRFTKPLLNRGPRPLGGIAHAALTPAETDGARELVCEEVALVLRTLGTPRIGESLCLLELLTQLQEP